MATQIPDSSLLLREFGAGLLTEREVIPRARLIVRRIAELVPGAAVVVYVVENQGNPEWIPKATLGDVRVALSRVPWDSGTLGEVAASREAFACEPAALTREDFAHLDVRRTVLSLVYVPLLAQQTLVGAIEIVSFEVEFDDEALEPVVELAEHAALAISSALSYESERNASLRFAKPSLFDQILQILIGGGYEPEVDFLCGSSTQALNRVLLKDPQQLAL